MTKSLRRIAAFGVLLLGAAVTISNGTPPPAFKQGPDDLWVWWTKTPGRKVCAKTKSIVEVQYYEGPNWRLLAPLVTFYPGEKDVPRDAGKIEVSSERGKFEPPTSVKAYHTGMAQFIYTPQQAGQETLTAKLTYPQSAKGATAKHFFTIVDCREVFFKLDASIIVVEGGDFTTVSIKGEGWLTYYEGKVTGDVDLKGEFTKMPNNDAAKCTVVKGTEGKGKVHVEGTMEESMVPKMLGGTSKIVLKLTYEKITGINQDGKTVCKDKVTGKIVREIPLKGLKEMDPKEYLKTELVYPEGSNKDQGTFGPEGGKAEYEFVFGW